ncbi:hypothetical protein I4U23_003472 [Adineta vaga]|nr:hypothetical protein I4U23_003472 [Adineta vaga]
MVGATKMIIITCDETFIQRLSSNQTANTQIIDLDDNIQPSSIIKDKHTLLTDLSTCNFTNNNQIYKRTLESPHENQSKQMKLSKKSVELVCAVCGDRAIGYNYDVPSCAPCKAFFHRNAHQSREKLKCFTNQSQCSVAHETRRKCSRCRLDRCFAVGMRKDFILTEEEKQRRRELIEENRSLTSKRSSSTSTAISTSEPLDDIDQLLMNMINDSDDFLLNETFTANEIENILFDPLSTKDWQTIEHIRSSLLSTFPRDNFQCFCVDVTDRTSALLSWSQFAYQVALHFINFFRKIEEFQTLHSDDRFLLIKYNLISLFTLSKCFAYQPINDCCSSEDNVFAQKNRLFFSLCGDSYGVRDTFVKSVTSLVEITSQDPIIISLLLIILLFSQGFSMNENQPQLQDSLAVHTAQAHYTNVLWNYLVHKCGEGQTYKYFTRLMNVIIQIQSTGKIYREFLRVQYMGPDVVDRMAPLMQTVLHIS